MPVSVEYRGSLLFDGFIVGLGLNQQYMVMLVYMPLWVIESYREKWFFTVFIE